VCTEESHTSVHPKDPGHYIEKSRRLLADGQQPTTSQYRKNNSDHGVSVAYCRFNGGYTGPDGSFATSKTSTSTSKEIFYFSLQL
jgi:hypothetical protein